MDTRDPWMVDKLGYVSAGILTILGLVGGLWTLNHMYQVGVISWMGIVFSYLLLAGAFAVIYGDLWLMEYNQLENVEE